MKILNYTNFVQFGLKSSDDKKSSKTKIQTLDYKTNPNISYSALNSSFFNNQKLMIKNTKLKNCSVSFKSNSEYNERYYKNILASIIRFYYITPGKTNVEVTIEDIKRESNDVLSKTKKALEENIKEKGFPVLKIDPEKSKKENKNIINNHLKKLKHCKMLLMTFLKSYEHKIKSGLSTSYFMKYSEAFSKIPNKEDILEIQNNILQTILLKTMSSIVLEHDFLQEADNLPDNIVDKHLKPYLFIETMPDDKTQEVLEKFKYSVKTQKILEKIPDYVKEFVTISIYDVKIKLFEKKMVEAQNLLTELEKPEVPQISQQDADRNLEEFLALCDQEQIKQKSKTSEVKSTKKTKKKKRKTSLNKKIQNQQQTKPLKQEKIEKDVEISDKDETQMSIPTSDLNSDSISTLSSDFLDIDTEMPKTTDITENGEQIITSFDLNDKIADLIEYDLSQDVEIQEKYSHTKNYASLELTQFFMENVYNSQNLDKSIKDKLSTDDCQHFVGAFLLRFQEAQPEATIKDCVNACTEILNNGAIVHSKCKNGRTQLDLYSRSHKTIIPFYVASDNKIHLTTMFIPTDVNMNSRLVANPVECNTNKFQSLKSMHEYLSNDRIRRTYYTLQNSIEKLKELQGREYRV